MSNALTRVVPWGTSSGDLAQLVDRHRELAALSAVSPFLVYGEPGFANYLSSVLDSPEHLFTRFAGVDGEGALCHLRIVDGVTFLNNIYLAPALRGKGNGSRLLAESIRRLGVPPKGAMELDAFESNSSALEWYRRLGFREVGVTSWSLFDVPKDSTAAFDVVEKPDKDGFRQIYVAESRIGTGFGRHAVLAGSEFLGALTSDRFDDVVVRSSGRSSDLGGVLLETSIRLQAPLATVIKELDE